MPISTIFEDKNMNERYQAHRRSNGACGAKLLPHGLDGQGLIMFFQEAMSLQLIQGATLSVLIVIEVIEGVLVDPDFLSLIPELRPEGIQEPDALFLVGLGSDLC